MAGWLPIFFRAPASPGFKAHPVARFYGWIILEGTARICKRFFETCSVGKLSLSQLVSQLSLSSFCEKIFSWEKIILLVKKNHYFGGKSRSLVGKKSFSWRSPSRRRSMPQ